MRFEEIDIPLEFHQQLNPKLWDSSNDLKTEVREKLILIAKDFYQYCELKFPVLDVIISGSNVNYNYTDLSDLDLHLITDYSKIRCDRELAELFDTKRLLYEQEHDIKIYQIPVTLYVEDQAQPGVSAGVYSVVKNQWLREPVRQQFPFDPKTIKHWVTVWETVITAAQKLQDLNTAKLVLDLLRKYRKLGLAQRGGEFSTENLVYKVLRNQQSLSNLNQLVNDLHDQKLSLT